MTSYRVGASGVNPHLDLGGRSARTLEMIERYGCAHKQPYYLGPASELRNALKLGKNGMYTDYAHARSCLVCSDKIGSTHPAWRIVLTVTSQRARSSCHVY